MALYMEKTKTERKVTTKFETPVDPPRHRHFSQEHPTPSWSNHIYTSTPSTRLSPASFASVRDRPRHEIPPLSPSASLPRGASRGRSVSRVDKSASLAQRSASVERSASLDRSKRAAPHLRPYIPHDKNLLCAENQHGLRDSLREERQRRRTNGLARQGNTRFKGMSKEERNDYMKALGVHRQHGPPDFCAALQTPAEKMQMEAQDSLLSEALGDSYNPLSRRRDNRAAEKPRAEKYALHATLAANTSDEDTTGVTHEGSFYVEFGEGPMGMSFDLNESNTCLLVTKSEGAAKIMGIHEGDVIAEVNGTLLPFDFTEEDLFDLLTQSQRPISVGFQRGDGSTIASDQEDGEDSAFFRRFTALSSEPANSRG